MAVDAGGEPSSRERLPYEKRDFKDYNAPTTGSSPGVHPASREAPRRKQPRGRR